MACMIVKVKVTDMDRIKRIVRCLKRRKWLRRGR